MTPSKQRVIAITTDGPSAIEDDTRDVQISQKRAIIRDKKSSINGKVEVNPRLSFRVGNHPVSNMTQILALLEEGKTLEGVAKLTGAKSRQLVDQNISNAVEAITRTKTPDGKRLNAHGQFLVNRVLSSEDALATLSRFILQRLPVIERKSMAQLLSVIFQIPIDELVVKG